ncbi:MAG: hypothetical protein COA66_07925 [Arcobacter sp.]|nr:MAG: hypothetical protein COA66_07925 [Arcobacter sp.]
MKRLFSKFIEDKLYIEITIASVLFLVAMYTNKMIDFIIYMLYFIIFLEIVRAVINYIREQRVILSLLVDAFIILSLREFIVNVVKINDMELSTFDEVLKSGLNFNLLILAGTILFLLFVRFLAVKTSQQYLLGKKKND